MTDGMANEQWIANDQWNGWAIRRRQWSLAIVAVVVCVAGAAAQGTGRIVGRVTDRDGAGVSGAVVSLSGAAALQAIADEDGRFTIDALAAGTYTVTAAGDGLRSATSTVLLGESTTRAVELTLVPACVTSARGIPDLGIATNITAADAVIYVRIRDAGKRTRLTTGNFCVDGHEHQADVLGIVKAPSHITATIRLVRSGPQPYRNGDRYIVFVHTHPSGAFLDLGDNAFQVQNGRVHWTRSDLPGVSSDAPVEQVMERLQETLGMTR
jgi:hypothetical protein